MRVFRVLRVSGEWGLGVGVRWAEVGVGWGWDTGRATGRARARPSAMKAHVRSEECVSGKPVRRVYREHVGIVFGSTLLTCLLAYLRMILNGTRKYVPGTRRSHRGAFPVVTPPRAQVPQ